MTPDDLIQGLTNWAKEEPRVRALVLTGSRARTYHPPDRWSDTDFDVYADEHEALLGDLGWLDRFGPRWLTVIWEGEIMTMFEGGLMAGIELRAVSDVRPRTREFVALWDPQRLITRADPGPPPSPSQAELDACVSHFWLHVLYTARRLGRGDLYMAVDRLGQIRHFAVQMLEWHARAGGAADTWYDGRHMAEWAEPWAVESMSRLAAPQDAAAVKAALVTAITLFKRLTVETSERLGLPEPSVVADDQVERVVTEWLANIK